MGGRSVRSLPFPHLRDGFRPEGSTLRSPKESLSLHAFDDDGGIVYPARTVGDFDRYVVRNLNGNLSLVAYGVLDYASYEFDRGKFVPVVLRLDVFDLALHVFRRGNARLLSFDPFDELADLPICLDRAGYDSAFHFSVDLVHVVIYGNGEFAYEILVDFNAFERVSVNHSGKTYVDLLFHGLKINCMERQTGVEPAPDGFEDRVTTIMLLPLMER